jgi:hypothetical protein
MSLIFDSFPSTEKADAFVSVVKERYGLDGAVYSSQEASQDQPQLIWDPFPWGLDPPIVLIERHESVQKERAIETAVEPFGGTFVGT